MVAPRSLGSTSLFHHARDHTNPCRRRTHTSAVHSQPIIPDASTRFVRQVSDMKYSFFFLYREDVVLGEGRHTYNTQSAFGKVSCGRENGAVVVCEYPPSTHKLGSTGGRDFAPPRFINKACVDFTWNFPVFAAYRHPCLLSHGGTKMRTVAERWREYNNGWELPAAFRVNVFVLLWCWGCVFEEGFALPLVRSLC